MADLIRQTLTGPGQIVADGGQFFKLIETGSAVDVVFERGGATKQARGVEAGYQYGPLPADRRFDRVKIIARTGQTIAFLIGDDYEDYDRVLGVFELQLPSSLASVGDVSVGTTAAVVVGANSARHRVHVTNMDSERVVRLGGADVAAGRGLPLQPGMTATLQCKGAVWGVTTSGTVALAVLEEVG